MCATIQIILKSNYIQSIHPFNLSEVKCFPVMDTTIERESAKESVETGPVTNTNSRTGGAKPLHRFLKGEPKIIGVTDHAEHSYSGFRKFTVVWWI